MDADGVLAPATTAEACDAYEAVGPAAQVVVREVARAMEFDRETYRERVTDDVVATAHDALFASLLEVQYGTYEEFDAWRAENAGCEVRVIGSENVDRVVWHAFDGEAVAATYQSEPAAARATLRRQAFGRLYRDVV